MINTVVLDIGNVLAHFRWEEYLKECGYTDEIFRKVSNATVHSEMWKELDRGAQNEEELIARCYEQNPSIEMEIKRFFDHMEEIVKEYDYSKEFIKRLKANGNKVYLLSNYGKSNFQLAKENFEFIKEVDGGVISYEVKHIKPEPEIYEALINKYNINPHEAVFLDDLPANLEGAKVFGFHIIHVKEFEKAVDELKELGVIS
jgi:putative hydrolase of the HAD superfamily